MNRALYKPNKNNDLQGYISDNPENVSEIKTVSSRFEIVAKVFSKGKIYYGVIEDAYSDETQDLLTCSIDYDNSESFKHRKIMMLKLQIPSGETMYIQCNVKWFLKASDDSKTLILGIKIIDPPILYKKFIKEFNFINN